MAYGKLRPSSVTGVTLEDLSSWLSWCRLDPRLAEIWVDHVSRNWKKLDPCGLARASEAVLSSQALGPLLEFVVRKGERTRNETALIRSWKRLATHLTHKVEGELFFVGLRTIGSDSMRLDAQNPAEEYARWGFLGRENLSGKQGRVTYPKPRRLEILRDLSQKNARFTVNEYLNAISNSVSIRQAERDLNSAGFVRRLGKTKGARWR